MMYFNQTNDAFLNKEEGYYSFREKVGKQIIDTVYKIESRTNKSYICAHTILNHSQSVFLCYRYCLSYNSFVFLSMFFEDKSSQESTNMKRPRKVIHSQQQERHVNKPTLFILPVLSLSCSTALNKINFAVKS